MSFDWRRALRGTPWLLVLAAATIVALSFLAIRSASFDAARGAFEPYAERQLEWAIVAFAAFAIAAAIPYDRVAARADAIYVLSLVALALVFVIGVDVNGAVRWFAVLSVRVQPSEFGKYALVLVLAKIVALEGEKIRTLVGLVPPLAVTLVPFALVAKQPDLTTAITYLVVLGVVLFVAGARVRHLGGAVAVAALAAPLAWRFLIMDYQKKRLLDHLAPERVALGGAYQPIQARIAIGSGGLFGKGFEQGTQGPLGFIPERHTDFIFAVIGEEWGFVGGVVLLALYGLLVYALAKIAQETRDAQGRAIVAGVAAILVIHVGVNVGMATGATPVAGITLPLVSYGGSSLLATMLGLGLAASVARRKVVVWAPAPEGDREGSARRKRRERGERSMERA